ncbi:ABC transporter substrate-binding protein [Jiangella sp. DSM 45060]|uniref:ABC transporter substrate-binding protein n=1 Tax=Jiangella sp. DSM 45060 TaxID=1798224 RepID=UPI000879EABA|nr:ABC transporter substrate-binding protein [Jiangella sp. DSM 45060]SDS44609.1 monosaccharide ABC transporter substrate-binding protein, CUT2 family [Jiangella sp. DSM 45060]
MTTNRLLGPALLAVSVLAATACGTSAQTESGGDDGGALDISLLTTYNGLPFYTAMLCGAKDAAADLGGGIEISTDGPSRGMNAADQVPVLESVVNAGPDGLIFVPADPQAMLAPVRTAVDSGIAVVTTDAVLADEVALAQFHGDSIAGGALAAEELLTRVGDAEGKVLVLDNRPGLPLTNERAEGFITGLEGAGNLEVLETQYFEDDPNQASSIVQSSLQAHPDIVGIFATAEAGATGAANALQAMNAEDVAVIAYDAGPVLVRGLQDGTLDALVAQGSYQQGYDALTRLVSHLRDEDTADLPFDNVVDNVLVTADNMDDPEVAKFLYPESCS